MSANSLLNELDWNNFALSLASKLTWRKLNQENFHKLSEADQQIHNFQEPIEENKSKMWK